MRIEGGSSPHTRGAPWPARWRRTGRRIIPAYAGSTWHENDPAVAHPDHPRIRGEHKDAYRAIARAAGSSPHTRGARPGRCRRGVSPEDHPRIRGEHAASSLRLALSLGSSPHTRGAPASLDMRPGGVGIIPAYAGSTRGRIRPGRPPSDHPRIRGEHDLPAQNAHEVDGSSPHTRGALRKKPRMPARKRIIPAYAGSTFVGSWCLCRSTDHPRIRGEHGEAAEHRGGVGGSSPHTRGARILPLRRQNLLRIIPAYAGSTDGPHTTSSPAWDHPRIRGEHVRVPTVRAAHVGSSPHTRGAPTRPICRGRRLRIIPAYAGSTRLRGTPWRWTRDHPRIRGEHRIVCLNRWVATGSSPHTRGARPAACPGPCRRRIIPAYAGSTPW